MTNKYDKTKKTPGLVCTWNMEKILPGHDPMLQFCVSLRSPTQSEPLLIGGGLVQVRVLTWLPGPHEELHGPHAPHSVKLPLTVEEKKRTRRR